MDAREREFDNLKIRLEELRRGLMHRVGAIRADIQGESGADNQNVEEQAQAAENDEVLDALDDQTRKELERVEAALQRMGAGDYGECVDCGEPIQLVRLKAIPWAWRCVDCARKHES